MYIIDIETKPRPDKVTRFTKPFAAFDPNAVKYGNAKDPAKRAEILAAAEQKHEEERLAYLRNATEKAALNPLTAEVLVIGLLDTESGELTMLYGNEADMLKAFWEVFDNFSNAVDQFVFWSGNGSPSENFDPDMIIRRSWINGVKVSARAINGRYLANRWVDAAARYLLFKREAWCSLTDAADQLGLYSVGCEIFPKSEDDPVTGKNFWQWWEGSADVDVPAAQQRAFAEKYLRNDLLTLKAIAERIL